MKILINKNLIDRFSKPYIIAEIGSNHNGNLKLCKKIVFAAKQAGADAVKFQMFSEKSLFSNIVFQNNNFKKGSSTKNSLRDAVKKYSLSLKDFLDVRKYCKKIKIDFGITPLSYEEAYICNSKLQPDYLKIASMDCNNYDFIKYVASFKRTTILSTGLSNMSEIDAAVRAFESGRNKKLIILHCNATYPPSDKDNNLLRIKTLQELYPYPIGFSDHSLGPEISIASVALGVKVIEKHFTINKKLKGWDHHMSLNPEELKALTTNSRRVFLSLGSPRVTRVENDNQVKSFRRSIVAKKNLKKGEILTVEKLDYKRPGTGLDPNFKNFILGRKIKNSIVIDQIIKLKDLY